MDPEVISTPAFKVIHDADTSKNKETATKEFSYIWYFADYKSPYINLQEPQRAQAIKEDFIKDPSWSPNERITAAIIKYKELQYTPAMRLIEAAEKACDKLSEYFLTVDLTAKNKMGQLIHKNTDLSKSLKDVGGIVQSLQVLKEHVRKETFGKKTRGSAGEASEFEK